MPTKKLTSKQKSVLKKKYSYRGAITDIVIKTGLHRTTVSRIIETGKGEEASIQLFDLI